MNEYQPIVLEQFDEFPSYRGGHTCLYGGYIWEFCPGHRLQNKWGWIAQHRLIAEDRLGRPLRQGRDPTVAEHVHHIDGCRTNNSPENLEVLTKSAHHSYEGRKANEPRVAKIPHEAAVAALRGRTIKEAAVVLGVSHMTLRRRAPAAVVARQRAPSTSAAAPQNLEEIRQMAGSDQFSLHDIAVALRMSNRTVSKILKIHAIPWTRKSKKGMIMRTRNGKPTRSALELRASGIDPDSTRFVRNRKRPRYVPPAYVEREEPALPVVAPLG